jgi:hypothetical protein
MAFYGRINTNKVIQSINALQIWAIEDLQKNSRAKQDAMLVEIDHFAARVDSVLYRLDIISELTNRLIAEFSSRGQSVPPAGPLELTDARHEVNTIFYDLARVQDRIAVLPSRLLGYQNEPRTFRNIIKKLSGNNKLRSFFVDAKDIYLEYWGRSGESLRDYRNLATHYHPIFDKSYFDNKTNMIFIPVPDNPDATSWKNLTFDKSYNGVSLASEYSYELFDFCEQILQKLVPLVIPEHSNARKGGRVLVSEQWPGDGLKVELKSKKNGPVSEVENPNALGGNMNPIVLVDKSFLQSLSKDEIYALHRHFSILATPILLQEIITDLVKSKYTPDEATTRVISLALRAGGVSQFTIDDARILFHAQLDGCAFKLEPKIPRFDGKRVQAPDGSIGIVFGETFEDKLLRRWQDNNFTEEDKKAAESYQSDLDAYYSMNHHAELGKQFPENNRYQTMDEMVDWIDNFALTSSEAWSLIECSSKLTKTPRDVIDKARLAWEKMGKPPLRETYPYVYYFTRVFDIYSFGLTNCLIPARKKANAIHDVQYFLYMPFCHAFCSSDRFHQENFKYFQRPEQLFVWGPDFKNDLAKIASFHKSLSGKDAKDYARQRGSYPPPIQDSISVMLWCDVNGPWEAGRFGNRAVDMSPEEQAETLRTIKERLGGKVLDDD